MGLKIEGCNFRIFYNFDLKINLNHIKTLTVVIMTDTGRDPEKERFCDDVFRSESTRLDKKNSSNSFLRSDISGIFVRHQTLN